MIQRQTTEPHTTKASDLRRALNVLDPERSLETNDELRDWFVSRPGTPLDDLTMLLENATGPQKVLFTGHRGSGKSTELAKLGQSGIADRFFVVRYSVKSVLNLFDLSHVDVLLSMGLQLIRRTTNQRIPVGDDVLEQFLKFGKDISRDTEIGETSRPELGLEVNFLVGKLASKYAVEDATRNVAREKVSHRIGDLLESIDIVSRKVESRTEKRVLVIVEDLDKTDLDTAKRLFYGHATSLSAPQVSVIYTFPTALRHDNDFMQIEMNFPSPQILPNIKVSHRDGTPDEDGRQCLRDLFTNRVEQTLIADDALDRLVDLSSGIPRELVVLGRQASLEARKAENARIELDNVERAAQRKRVDYEVLLTRKQLELLAQVNRTKSIENDEDHRSLLHNLSVLEHRNNDVWYDVHPIILPLLGNGE
jgi:hypothetical protein